MYFTHLVDEIVLCLDDAAQSCIIACRTRGVGSFSAQLGRITRKKASLPCLSGAVAHSAPFSLVPNYSRLRAGTPSPCRKGFGLNFAAVSSFYIKFHVELSMMPFCHGGGAPFCLPAQSVTDRHIPAAPLSSTLGPEYMCQLAFPFSRLG